MGINEALELFEISDISTETEETLKTKFRQLSKKYHPDNSKTGDNKKFLAISEALETLKETLVKLRQYQLMSAVPSMLTIVFPLYKLVDIYNGESITVGSGADATEIDKRAMKQNNTLIISEATIEHNGLVNTFSNIQKWNVDDTYSVNCDIAVDDITATEKIKIKILDKVRELDMTFQSLKIRFTLQYNINVDVIINKKIIVNKE